MAHNKVKNLDACGLAVEAVAKRNRRFAAVFDALCADVKNVNCIIAAK
jgi:hypothetical protein